MDDGICDCPDDVDAIRKSMGIPVHDDGAIRGDFFAFLEEGLLRRAIRKRMAGEIG